MKLVAEDYGRDDIEGIGRYVTTAFALLCLSGAVALVVILALKEQIITAFKLTGHNAETVSWLLPYIGFLSIYVFVVQALNATLSGLGRMDLANYIQTGGRIVAVASGGQLARLCQAEGWDFVQIPGGLQPRAAIGYSLAAVVLVLVGFRVLPQSVLDELVAGARLMASEGERWGDPDQPENEPLEAARLIGKRLPIIYGATSTTEALALRLRCQLAENSKLLASHHILPEQNHNEIVGLVERMKDPGDAFVIWLTDSDDHPRVRLRQDLSARLMGTKVQPQSSPPVECTLAGSGESLIQRNLTLLHKIDWLSYYVALLRGYDPSDIEILTKLKKEMKPE